MSPVQQTPKDQPKRHFGPAGLLLVGAVTLVPVGALVLGSGPNSPHAAPVAESAAALSLPDVSQMPLQQLGAAAPADSWRRGTSTFYIGNDEQPEHPLITLQAADFEPGRYEYPGDVRIVGELTTSGLEITAGSIHHQGGIAAEAVTLRTLEGGPVQQDFTPFHMVRSGGEEDMFFLASFKQLFRDGPITIDGSVTGNAITIEGGQIEIGGTAQGDITITGSTGETLHSGIHSEFFNQYKSPYDWRDGVPAEHFWEAEERVPAPFGEQPTVAIAGGQGPGVTVDLGGPAETHLAAVPTRRP